MARGCPKHVEKRNKYTKQNCAPSWIYLQGRLCILCIYFLVSAASELNYGNCVKLITKLMEILVISFSSLSFFVTYVINSVRYVIRQLQNIPFLHF